MILCIETSAPPYGVVLAQAGKILFDSTTIPELSERKDVAAIVEYAFAQTGRRPAELQSITVNCGPGATNAVRVGVSFANSLAYSLGIGVMDANVFQLLGYVGKQKWQLPVLTTVKSIRGAAHVGWYAEGKLQSAAYGPMAETVQKVVGDANEWVVAGAHREAVIDLFPDRKVQDMGLKFGAASTMVELQDELADRLVIFPHLPQPITEQSSLFV